MYFLDILRTLALTSATVTIVFCPSVHCVVVAESHDNEIVGQSLEWPCTDGSAIQWIRDPTSCGKYYICHFGQPLLMPDCPYGQIWGIKARNCVPENSRWDDCNATRYHAQTNKTDSDPVQSDTVKGDVHNTRTPVVPPAPESLPESATPRVEATHEPTTKPRSSSTPASVKKTPPSARTTAADEAVSTTPATIKAERVMKTKERPLLPVNRLPQNDFGKSKLPPKPTATRTKPTTAATGTSGYTTTTVTLRPTQKTPSYRAVEFPQNDYRKTILAPKSTTTVPATSEAQTFSPHTLKKKTSGKGTASTVTSTAASSTSTPMTVRIPPLPVTRVPQDKLSLQARDESSTAATPVNTDNTTVTPTKARSPNTTLLQTLSRRSQNNSTKKSRTQATKVSKFATTASAPDASTPVPVTTDPVTATTKAQTAPPQTVSVRLPQNDFGKPDAPPPRNKTIRKLPPASQDENDEKRYPTVTSPFRPDPLLKYYTFQGKTKHTTKKGKKTPKKTRAQRTHSPRLQNKRGPSKPPTTAIPPRTSPPTTMRRTSSQRAYYNSAFPVTPTTTTTTTTTTAATTVPTRRQIPGRHRSRSKKPQRESTASPRTRNLVSQHDADAKRTKLPRTRHVPRRTMLPTTARPSPRGSFRTSPWTKPTQRPRDHHQRRKPPAHRARPTQRFRPTQKTSPFPQRTKPRRPRPPTQRPRPTYRVRPTETTRPRTPQKTRHTQRARPTPKTRPTQRPRLIQRTRPTQTAWPTQQRTKPTYKPRTQKPRPTHAPRTTQRARPIHRVIPTQKARPTQQRTKPTYRPRSGPEKTRPRPESQRRATPLPTPPPSTPRTTYAPPPPPLKRTTMLPATSTARQTSPPPPPPTTTTTSTATQGRVPVTMPPTPQREVKKQNEGRTFGLVTPSQSEWVVKPMHLRLPQLHPCRARPGQLVAHPRRCHWYYNCTRAALDNLADRLTVLEEECRYPQLFDTVTGRCREFINVNCQGRFEPVDPCEYHGLQCRRSANCVPCNNRFGGCRGRANGIYPFHTNRWTPTFVTCYMQRNIAQDDCQSPTPIFSPVARDCVALFDVPKPKGGLMPDCAHKEDGFYPDEQGRCGIFFECRGGEFAGYDECPSGTVFDPMTLRCQLLHRATPPCGEGQNPSCSDRQDGFHADPFGRCPYYFECRKRQFVRHLTCDYGSFDPVTQECVIPTELIAQPCGLLPNPCEGKSSGFFPYRNGNHHANGSERQSGAIEDRSCQRYVECSRGVMVSSGTCPAGTVFSAISGRCDRPEDAPEPCGMAPSCEGKEDGKFSALTRGCSFYFECKQKRFAGLRQCSIGDGGFFFNERTGRCDFPQNICPPCGYRWWGCPRTFNR